MSQPASQHYNTLEELSKQYPFRTYKKFKDVAHRYGFTDDKAIKEFLNNRTVHDIYKPTGLNQLPIYSKSTGAYQFDTIFEGKNGTPHLLFINVNTRKVYVYRMPKKDSQSVLTALQKFKRDAGDVNVLTSDQDPAYLTPSVIKWMQDNQIDYRTTHKNNHNILGILNRFVRTLRDLNGDRRLEDNIQQLVAEYNQTVHSSLTINGQRHSPNQMTAKDEQAYSEEKDRLFRRKEQEFNEGDHVRLILDKKKLGKNRWNVSPEAYIVVARHGNNWIIRARDNTAKTYPGYRLVKCDKSIAVAAKIADGQEREGVIEKLISYDGAKKSDKYKAKWEGVEGTYDVTGKELRTGRPTQLSNIERQYWARQERRHLPAKIRQLL